METEEYGIIIPEIAFRYIIKSAITEIRSNIDILNQIFSTMLQDGINIEYGQTHIDKIKNWLSNTNIPIVLAWELTPERIPCYSIHLSSESEDENKASIGDFYGETEDSEIGVGVFNVIIDVGMHAPRDSDMALWMYYILNYILFTKKQMFITYGIQLHTFSASEYKRDLQYIGEGIYSRWIRFKCTIENTWTGTTKTAKDIDNINIIPQSIEDNRSYEEAEEDEDISHVDFSDLEVIIPSDDE